MEEKEIHLRDYFRIVRKRRLILYTFFLIAFTLVLIVTFTATPQYMASARLLIEKNEQAPLSKRYYYTPYDPEFLNTQYQIIKSYRVARKVVDILALDKNYATYFPEGKKKVANAAEEETEKMQEDLDGQSKADKIADMISNGIIVTPVEESKIVDLGFVSPNPTLAKMIVNTVAKAYMEEILEIKMNSAGYAIKWMTEKAEEEKTKLEKSEKALQEYMRAKDIVTIEDRMTVVPEKLAEVSTQLTKSEAKRKELETLYTKIQEAKNRAAAETMPVIASSSTIQSLRDQILKAEQNITELSKKYGHKHPVMISAVSDLKILNKKKEQEINRVSESIKNDRDLARSNEENLRRFLAQTREEALSLNEKFIQYSILKREVDTNRLMYEALITRAKEQSITEQTQTVNIWLVESAKTPQYPAKPNKKRNIMLGIVVGLFGGIGLCFFVEYLDNTLKSPEEMEEKLGESVLGVVALDKQENAGGAWEEPKAGQAESYKALRTAVLLSSADAHPRTILITSMSPQEGKTTTSVNLAFSIAQADHRVVLVDADLRKPRVHKIFKLPPTKGLSTYLAGGADKDIICEGPAKNFHIIPSGPIPPNPSELLSSSRMKELLEYLTKEYDIVIFDSPPIISITDSLILGRIVDGTIIITKGGSSTYEIVARGLKSLRDVNARILGLVLNAVDMKKSDYYYHSGYYSYYSDEGEAES